MHCSPRCACSRPASLRRWPTCRTRSPVTSGPRARPTAGAPRTARPAPRARGAERPVTRRCSLLLALAVAIPVLAACSTHPVGSATVHDVAWVANLESTTVTPVDLGTWRAGPPIAVGAQPVAIAVSTASSGAATAFVADFGANAVTPIDLSTRQPGAAIPVGPGPQAIAVAAGEVLVGNFGNRSLTPINASTMRAGAAVALPLNPPGIAVAASGATAY